MIRCTLQKSYAGSDFMICFKQGSLVGFHEIVLVALMLYMAYPVNNIISAYESQGQQGCKCVYEISGFLERIEAQDIQENQHKVDSEREHDFHEP